MDHPATFIPNDKDLVQCMKHRERNGLTIQIGKINCETECPIHETCPNRKEA